jgi:pimeloyl-ACP methyl ester carboxylesterase
MADSQVPWSVDALAGAITEPAWRTKPTWYLIATEDRMIPPDAQRFMAQRANAQVSETAASHSVYISQPEAVAAIIETADKGVS